MPASHSRLLPLAAALLVLATGASAQDVTTVKFAPGKTSAQLHDSIRGHAYRDYRLEARAGQSLEVRISDTGPYFNILPPGSKDVAIYIGSMNGNTARLQLPADGLYTVRVYLMGGARDGGKTRSFTLDVAIH